MSSSSYVVNVLNALQDSLSQGRVIGLSAFLANDSILVCPDASGCSTVEIHGACRILGNLDETFRCITKNTLAYVLSFRVEQSGVRCMRVNVRFRCVKRHGIELECACDLQARARFGRISWLRLETTPASLAVLEIMKRAPNLRKARLATP